ncbi:TAT-variant-translocated molybdopterin oxidoreductase [Psychroflexus planctonicus]|uniref:Quinol:cytochrome C oxidoreductase n=1 Tax=Psychroflexus planctonicus TaxID=1526575 RepID=A0ABQ1SBG8_9FLAO|nr:TAT-variant-translocated molybdopterin oxidoreductase [Psychroflexus planctonicus]GGE24416.1 quinol:cytochrome C oxidoreductase [Psychroflexus planctonicus]
MSSEKKYWKSEEELKENSPIVSSLEQNEFVEHIPADEFLGDKNKLENSSTSRRDFLKYVGFSTAAASLAACEGPVIKSIPYVVQPERLVPGVADYYASTIADGFDFASVLVKTREGRPIKIETNKEAGVMSAGKARIHASVLSLYDVKRLQNPTIGGQPTTWSAFDDAIKVKMEKLGDKPVVFLTQTLASPSTKKLINKFVEQYPNTKHVVYDAVSESAALDAFQQKYGFRALPNYDFSKAETIVSVGADFLGDWQGGSFDSGYSQSRVPKDGKMSKHVQFEANMTLSGANSDTRIAAKPSVQKHVLVELYNQIVGKVGNTNLNEKQAKAVASAAQQLKQAGSKGVVLCGINEVEAQMMAMEINETLNSSLVDVQNPRMIRQGNDQKVASLVKDMNAGKIGGLMMVGVNPAYSLPNADTFKTGLEKVDLVVDFAMKADETAMLSEFVAATPHYLESWGDVQFTKKNFSLVQPTIKPVFNTRQFQDCLLKWTGSNENYYEYLKSSFSEDFPDNSWNRTLHDGFFTANVNEVVSESEDDEDEIEVASFNASQAANSLLKANEGLELTLYTKTGLGDGQQANNPWLQEFPDPITRTSWDNYLTISKADAERLELENRNVANGALDGSYAKVTVNGVTLEKVPVYIQPGQAVGSVGLAVGYGRTEAIQDEMQVGINAYPLYQNFKAVQQVEIEKVSGNHEFACVQLHNTMMGRRDIIKETSLEIFNTKDKDVWNKIPEVSLDHQETAVDNPDVDLWDEFDRSIGHHFNLSIDLNACTGCGACVIACHSENNVPVVGKEEVRKSRDMHWLRIDRYYSSEDTLNEDYDKKNNIQGLGSALSEFAELENPAEESVEVVFQPVMCQHCNHAPCETVCPVAASAHGRQGQNHMTYNRCVGTRYCANNCPYKVRRFNWFKYNQNDEFDYHMNNDLGRMVLNPDVTVRARGVMEKCSMCIQMTQKTILDAKREGREIKDGEFQTACSNACDNGAIVFGDINDEESVVYQKTQEDRKYHLLEYLGTKPNVLYQTKVRNTTEA